MYIKADGVTVVISSETAVLCNEQWRSNYEWARAGHVPSQTKTKGVLGFAP